MRSLLFVAFLPAMWPCLAAAVPVGVGDILVSGYRTTVSASGPTYEGLVVRINPVTGSQSLVTAAGLLGKVNALAIGAPDRLHVLTDNTQIITVDASTGLQSHLASAQPYVQLADLVVDRSGQIQALRPYDSQASGAPEVRGFRFLEVDPSTGAQLEHIVRLGDDSMGGNNIRLQAQQVFLHPDGDLLTRAMNGPESGFGGILKIGVDDYILDRGDSGTRTVFIQCGVCVYPTGAAVAPDETIYIHAPATYPLEYAWTWFSSEGSLLGNTFGPVVHDFEFDSAGRLLGIRNDSILLLDLAASTEDILSSGNLLTDMTVTDFDIVTAWVPEPSTALLVALGLMLTAAARSRRPV